MSKVAGGNCGHGDPASASSAESLAANSGSRVLPKDDLEADVAKGTSTEDMR